MSTPYDSLLPLPVDQRSPWPGLNGVPHHTHPVPVTNRLAVASLVLGLLGFLWVTVVPALVCGYVARRQVVARGETGGGLALAGVVLGWLYVGLLGMVALRIAVSLA